MTNGTLRLVLVAHGPALATALHEGSGGRLAAHPVPTFELAVDCVRADGGDAIVVDPECGPVPGDDALERLRDSAPGVPVVLLGSPEGPPSVPLLDDGARAPLVALAVDQAIAQHRLGGSLRSEEDLYRAMVEASLHGIAVHQDGVIRFANHALARLFGHDDASALVGRPLLDLVARDEWPRLLAYRDARARGEATPQRYEFAGVRRDGAPIRVECLVAQTIWQGRPATNGAGPGRDRPRAGRRSRSRAA